MKLYVIRHGYPDYDGDALSERGVAGVRTPGIVTELCRTCMPQRSSLPRQA